MLEGLSTIRVRKGGGTEVPWELEFTNGTETKSVNAYDGGKWTPEYRLAEDERVIGAYGEAYED